MERNFWDADSRKTLDPGVRELFNAAINDGFVPYWYGEGSIPAYVGVENGESRRVEFIRRGRGRPGWLGPLLEVILADRAGTIRLGPFFNLDAHACVVVSGYEAAYLVCECWLGGKDVPSVLGAADFLDRLNLTLLERSD